MFEVAVALVVGVLLGWFLSWYAKHTFQFEVTIVTQKEEEVKEAKPNTETPTDINDADWWKHSE